MLRRLQEVIAVKPSHQVPPTQSCTTTRIAHVHSPVHPADLARLWLHEPLLVLGAVLLGVAAKLDAGAVAVAESEVHHTPALTAVLHFGGPGGGRGYRGMQAWGMLTNVWIPGQQPLLLGPTATCCRQLQ